MKFDESTLNMPSSNEDFKNWPSRKRISKRSNEFKNGPRDSETTSNDLSSTLSNLLKLEDNLNVYIRDRIIRILPQHWVDRILKIIQFQASKYR